VYSSCGLTGNRAASRAGFRDAWLSALLVLAVAASTLCSATPAAAQTDPNLQGNYDAASSFYQAGITASDINSDGRDELLIGNQNGYLYCFGPNARPLWLFNAGAAIQGTPACCDVNGDGKQEIWIGDMAGRLWGLDSSGRVLSGWGWPKETHEVGGIKGVFSSPAVGDINADGLAEVVVGSYGQRVYAWTYNGRMLPGWPYNNEDTVWSSPALADIDFDGVLEVVIGGDSTGGANWPYPPGGLLYVLDEDASVLPGFPAWTPEVTWSSPAVADIDADGRYEIVVGTGHYYAATGRLTTEGFKVYAYNHDGTTVAGWPATVAGATFSSPALGDVDGDGAREIVTGTIPVNGRGQDTITVLEQDGRISRVITGLGGPTMASPALGDVNSDGIPDIALGSGQEFAVRDHTGSRLFSRMLGNFVVTDPAVGDFDLDGRVEVATATGDAPSGSYAGGWFYVFELGASGPGGDDELYPWPMFRCTADHHATLLTGEEPPPPPPPTAKTWFLAEGTTGPGMETWITVQNPGDVTAKVTLRYLTPDGVVAGPWAMVAPRSRNTFNVGETLPDRWEVSTAVSSDRDVVVERAVYGEDRTWAHASRGVTEARRTWYVAEGSTGPGMETWIVVQNPNRTPANVTVSYMTSKGPRAGPTVLVPASSRRTFNAADSVPGIWGVSAKVTSDLPIVVERATYGADRTWGTCSTGVNLPATTWYLAEGYVGSGIESWIVVQNPTYPETAVRVDYMTESGIVPGPSVLVPSSSRATIKVSNTVRGGGAAAVVASGNPVVVEGAMYGNGGAWGHSSLGTTLPRRTWYLAEGSTGGGMETWVVAANPGALPATVKLTFMTRDGPRKGPTMVVPPCSRFAFFVADSVPDTWEVSTLVTSDRDVVVERAMYSSGRSWGTGATGFAP
jgi:FG-GAP-like repeat/FG-GAP repeat